MHVLVANSGILRTGDIITVSFSQILPISNTQDLSFMLNFQYVIFETDFL